MKFNQVVGCDLTILQQKTQFLDSSPQLFKSPRTSSEKKVHDICCPLSSKHTYQYTTGHNSGLYPLQRNQSPSVTNFTENTYKVLLYCQSTLILGFRIVIFVLSMVLNEPAYFPDHVNYFLVFSTWREILTFKPQGCCFSVLNFVQICRISSKERHVTLSSELSGSKSKALNRT